MSHRSHGALRNLHFYIQQNVEQLLEDARSTSCERVPRSCLRGEGASYSHSSPGVAFNVPNHRRNRAYSARIRNGSGTELHALKMRGANASLLRSRARIYVLAESARHTEHTEGKKQMHSAR